MRLLIVCFFGVTILPAAQHYYVAPGAPGSGDGSRQKPWSLQTALTNTSSIRPGDTVWLRGGTYSNLFTCSLNGTSNAPIVVRNYNGERAIIDGQIFAFGLASNTWFWGLELIDSQKTNRPTFATFFSGDSNIKLINCLIHDCSIGASPPGPSETYGCILWNCGKNELEHGLYYQNATDNDKVIENNIISNPSGEGMQIYGSAGQLKHFKIINNVCADASILVGGSYPIIDLLMASNDVYNVNPHAGGGGSIVLGWNTATRNSNAVVIANSISPGINFYNTNFTSVIFTNNVEYSPHWVMVTAPGYFPTNALVWDGNFYYSGFSAFASINGANQSFTTWKQNPGFDSNSSLSTNLPPDKVSIRPNKYEAKRAHIAVWNWSGAQNVAADVSGLLAQGDTYEVRNALDYFAGPVLSGSYSGGSLSLPMTNLTVAPYLYYTPTYPGQAWTNFAAFVLIGIGTNGTTAPPANLHIVTPK